MNMNERPRAFPESGSALAVVAGAPVPTLSGLRDVAFAAPPERDGFDLSEVLRILTKWRWLIAAIVVGCVVAALIVSLLITPVYRATATIQVNPQGVQVVQMGELEPAQGADRDFMGTQVGLLKSRSLAERVARSLNLANDSGTVDQGLPRPIREQVAANAVFSKIVVQPQRDTRLIQIAAEDTNPELAARIANSLADNFIQSNLERKFESTAYARNFLEQRISAVKKKLEESERSLVAYATQQGIVELGGSSKDSGGGQPSLDASSLMAMNDALQKARDDRIAAEQRYRRAQSSTAVTQSLNNPTVQTLTSQRAQLQAEYQQKLSTYQPEYPEMMALRARIDSLGSAIASESRNVRGSVSGSLSSEFQAAVARENALQARVNQLKGDVLDLRRRSIQYTILQREVDTSRSLYDALLQRFKEVGVAGGVGENLVSVIDRAQVPGGPFKPNLPLNLAIGLMAGLILGFGTAFAIEWIDDTVKTPDDLTAKLRIAALGVIPQVAKGGSVQEELQEPRSPISEAYQSVRTALQFSTDHGVPKNLLITSTRASEGKSSTALALSYTLASLGARVLLIDADLRKPTFKGLKAQQGLSSLLAGSKDVRGCIEPTVLPGLSLLPGGAIPPNPAELLASGRFAEVLDEVMQDFDHVIVDGPPVLGLADAPLLASVCEGTLMVIETGGIRRAAALNSVARLRAAEARLVGGVLTKFNAKKTGYGYGYGYGEEQYAYRQGEEPKKQIELLKGA
jgi:capsular exopolysaccharide synthesis family protein